VSTLPAWASGPDPLTITEDGYEALPDEYRKMIEVIDGTVFRCHSGTREHHDAARRLASLLEAAKPVDPCFAVSSEVDMNYARVTGRGFSFRRPDVSVYRCLPRGAKLMASDAVMVVEVVSPGSEYVDTVDKLAEYAHEGIPVYLVVFLDEDLYVKAVHEYRRDWVSRTYRLAAVHHHSLVLEDPFPVVVEFKELDS
jgi:Uma2 family endonuclease